MFVEMLNQPLILLYSIGSFIFQAALYAEIMQSPKNREVALLTEKRGKTFV